MKAHLNDRRNYHDPQQCEDRGGSGSECTRRNLRAAVYDQAGHDAEPDRKESSILKSEDRRIQYRQTVGNKRHKRRHADQERERVLDDRNARVDLDGPAAEFILCQSAPAAPVRDPGHYLTVHRRDHHDRKDREPHRRAERNMSNAGKYDELQEWPEYI